jgi:tetratricopeptide (TPR) repeat protein
MPTMRRSLILVASVIGCVAAAAGCGGAQLQEMQNQVNAQQAQIEQQAREIAELNAQQNVGTATTPPPPGSCDEDVMHKALADGDNQYAQGKYNLALGYYQDAGVACPGNPQVETSLARAYEKLGDSQEAARHYRNAHDATAATP